MLWLLVLVDFGLSCFVVKVWRCYVVYADCLSFLLVLAGLVLVVCGYGGCVPFCLLVD